jgi:hypothetical protein
MDLGDPNYNKSRSGTLVLRGAFKGINAAYGLQAEGGQRPQLDLSRSETDHQILARHQGVLQKFYFLVMLL